MRFLHTADWQIGMKALRMGHSAARIRDARVTSARKVIEAARQEKVDFMLLAGDTFEHNGIDPGLIQRVGDVLAAFGGPVYIIPGNHDPVRAGSVWDHEVWRSHANLHVLRRSEPLAIPGGLLFACPWSQDTTGDPLAWIPAESGNEIRIAVAHGNVEGLKGLETASLIPRDAPERYRLDYLALGHWHSTATYPPSMAYSGTHETTNFTETNSGNVLIVEIAAPGVPPAVRTVHTGVLAWRSETKVVSAPGQLRTVREEAEAWPADPNGVVALTISGVQYAAEAGEINRITELLASRFLWAEVNAQLVPAPEDESWIDALPAGPCRDAAQELRAQADAVSARALLELYAFAAEVQR